jgi:hypothetical protein
MSNIPGIGAMTDTLEFVKSMWGGMAMPGMKMPGMVMPTLSVDEINKQIADLKAVESWLTLNMNMLRGTIQALEVQSATISTLQSMSAAIGSMGKPNGAEEKPAFESPFSFAMPTAEKPPAPEPEPQPEAALPHQPQSQPQAAGDAANPVLPSANPAAWWNMLQDQFKHAVNTAMAPEPEPPAAKRAAAKPPGAKPPVAKSSAAPRKAKPKTDPRNK